MSRLSLLFRGRHDGMRSADSPNHFHATRYGLLPVCGSPLTTPLRSRHQLVKIETAGNCAEKAGSLRVCEWHLCAVHNNGELAWSSVLLLREEQPGSFRDLSGPFEVQPVDAQR